MDQEQEQFDEPLQDGLEGPPPDEQECNEPEMLAKPETEPVEIQHEADVPENQTTMQPDLPVQDPVPLRRSTRDRQPVQRLDITMSSKRHVEVTLPVVEQDVSDGTPLDYDFVMFICMMQMSVKAGLKKFEQQKAKKRLPKS